MEDQIKTAAMILTRTEDGFTVLDASGKVHEASSVEELGQVCAHIVDDPTLPEYETATTQTDKLSDVAEELARSVLPEKLEGLAPFAGPAVNAIKEAVTNFQVKVPARHSPKPRSTPESRAEGKARAEARIREKDRLKAEAKVAAQERRRADRPRLRSIRT